jgi:hypothetical protein
MTQEKKMAEVEKKTWEMNYSEIFDSWSSRHAFGAKGELSLSEARQVHNKWKKLGTLAKRGLL